MTNAGQIAFEERDIRLNLSSANWPSELRSVPAGWERTDGRLFRFLGEHGDFEESMLRFPSAPIYGTHRKFTYQLPLPRVNHHTLRFIRRRGSSGPVRRVYLFCNGMNEIDSIAFYHSLAEYLIADQTDVACLLRPLPGHLTRFPLPKLFAEKPLDRYLSDAGDLFRQFLRYLVEARWLLSALTPLETYRTASGLDLVSPEEGRGSPAALSRRIAQEWLTLREASRASLEPRLEREQDLDDVLGSPVETRSLGGMINALRGLLGHSVAGSDVMAQGPAECLPPPAFHLLGYSLGGFFAQSMFFAWPFALSTCTTIGAGGALRQVAPSAFAHREEWRYVLYCLRYEIESAMLQGTIANRSGYIAGLASHDFAGLLQIFYEIFLQEDQERYRTRLGEYVSRLLFVVGGNDPIVEPRNVLAASPEGGVNLVEVASLGHFVAKDQGEWRAFWLPAVAGLIAGFARRGEEIHRQNLFRNWWQKDTSGSWRPKPRPSEE